MVRRILLWLLRLTHDETPVAKARVFLLGDGVCDACQQPIVEIRRDCYNVYLRCGCPLTGTENYNWRHLLHNGKEYRLGSAGSIVHECPNCGEITLRMDFSAEVCVYCASATIRPVEVK